jgi:tRNA(fMet)-specific endonuclease VapC
MLYLLDTDHWSLLQKGKRKDAERLISRINAHGKAEIMVSIISFHEQCLGAHTYLTRSKTADEYVRGYELLQKVIGDFDHFSVATFDQTAAAQHQELRKARYRTSKMDLRIAAIALSIGATLLTRNTSDFQMIAGLVYEDWTVV